MSTAHIKISNLSIAIALLVAFLALVAGSAHASWEPRLEADIPFRFVVDNSTLPAGEYVFSTSPGEPNVLRIVRTDGEAGVLTLTQELADSDVPPGTVPGVVFEILEGVRFLEQIHIPSGGWHWEVDKGKEYIELKAGGSKGERETISPSDAG